jgi:hypothetical protein
VTDPAPVAPDTAELTAPPCDACGGPSIVHWLRRLTPEEVAEQQAKEQARRDRLSLLADPQQPPLEFGPLPDCADWTHAVYGCLTHYITKDAAARVHQATCTAPSPAGVPACDCTPEPSPAPDPDPTPAPLPPGW